MLIAEKAKRQPREYMLLMNLLKEFGFYSIRDFQKKKGLWVDGLFGDKSYNALYFHVLNVEEQGFTDYYKIKADKRIIVWHHAAGWDNARGMFKMWQRDGRGKVATAIGITDEGKVARGFNEEFYAHHIGAKDKHFQEFDLPNINKELNMVSVGVEVCNAGQLDNNGVSWFDWKVPKDKVVEVNYKGKKFYEAYTEEEIKALKYWTLLQGLRWGIPLYYREFDMWNVSKDALSGVAGLYTHNSFRYDKTDVSPQKPLIEMAKGLEEYYL